MTNQEISKRFEYLAAALQLIDQKKYFFQIRSYQKIAQVLRDLPEQIEQLYQEKKSLDAIEGIGPAIESKIIELLTTGHSEEMDQFISQVPAAVFPLLDVNGIGVKRAYKFVSTFQLVPKTAVDELEKLAQAGKIRTLEGFGEKSEQDIIEAINLSRHQEASYSYDKAFKIANELLKELKNCPQVDDALPLGSLRRKKARVRDIDLGISTTHFDQVKTFVKKIKNVKQILADGDNLIRVILQNNIQVDIKSSPPQRWGAFLQHFTGSKEHNIKLREFALKQDKSLSEHGIKLVDQDKKLVEFATEEEFYKYLGLQWIPPEKRVGEEEINQARIH
ncbi:MAG: helix-hairpin-helix domain-containing protein [Patescibacteria group bacterium]